MHGKHGSIPLKIRKNLGNPNTERRHSLMPTKFDINARNQLLSFPFKSYFTRLLKLD